MSATRSRSRRSMPVVVVLEGDNTHLANLCGPLDENLRQLADGMGVSLSRRGSRVTLEGERGELAGRALRRFHEQAVHRALSVDDIQLGLVEMTRKRTRDSLAHQLCEPCPMCESRGNVRTPRTVCYEILREILREA
ncbi:PhoH family protein, partial [Bordetella petrii]|nr:PhoH family protein [Bordetella petrii]